MTAGDLLGAQRDLAVAISTELGEPYGAVNEAIARRMAPDSTPSMPSYTCILRAYEYRRTFDDALFAPALDCLKQAVVRDPDYADAWAMLGWLHLDAVRRDIAPEAERPAEMAAAFDAASHAVELDPRNPRTLAALSAVTFYQGDYAAAETMQREVLALNPYDPDILAQLGWRLAVRGNREGLEYLEQAIARSANPPGGISSSSRSTPILMATTRAHLTQPRNPRRLARPSACPSPRSVTPSSATWRRRRRLARGHGRGLAAAGTRPRRRLPNAPSL